MKKSMHLIAILILAYSMAPGDAQASARFDKIVPPYGTRTGEVKNVDVQGGTLTIDGTSYSYAAKSISFRGSDNGLIDAQTLQPGVRIGYSTQTNATTGKQEISQIWILNSGAEKK